ncbi:PKD domain-containing protein, partial [Flavobacterium sp. NKUCC04_CG]|uniref:PKD domain-containing protein n=1 Tax=Flavobacterium sp. NKUCC04_CG TaxID=2842121 RepID=UPI001C5A8B11
MRYNYFYRIKKTLFENKCFLSLLLLCCSLSSMGQPLNNGAWLSWDQEVGCKTYDYDPNPKYDGYLEDIANAPCLSVCEGGAMAFYMRGNNIRAVSWEISGGTILREYQDRIRVRWENRGAAGLSFKVVFNDGSITQGSLCIEVLAAPNAAFKLQLPQQALPDVVCLNTPFVINNLSEANGGSQIVSYEWDFGDGNVSRERNPQHQYSRPGIYTISLQVTNECHCSSYFKADIQVEAQIAARISCPTVSCENSVQTYTVESACGGDWFVVGGEVIEENEQEIQVIWNEVDQDGFGYVSYISYCGCRNWTTVKIPVVKNEGTIQGNPTACVRKQQRFSMPQWPTTDFQWELLSLTGAQSTLTPTDQRNEIVLNPLEAGRYLLVCTYTNTLLKCGGRATFEIEVVAVPEITGPTEFCETPKGIVYESNLNIPLLWEVKKGNTLVHSQTANSLFWEGGTAGFYTITATHQDYCTSIPLLVTITELPDISEVELIGEKMVCPGAPYVYRIENDDANFTYEWEVTHGQIHGSRFGDEVTVTFDVGESLERSITVKKFSLNSLRCTSAPKRFNILAMNPQARFTNLENTVLFCPSTYSSFKVDFDNNIQPDHIHWESFPDNFANIVQGQGSKTVQVSWNEVSNTNSGFLRLTIRKCDQLYVFNHPITLFESPHFTWQNPNPLNVCVYEPFTVTLVSDSNLSGGRVIWDLNNGSEPTAASPISGTRISSPPLAFEEELNDDIARVITATIINPNGCETQIQLNLNVLLHPKPVITVTPNGDIFVCPENGYAVTLYATHQLDIPDQNMEWYKSGQAGVLGYGPRYTVVGDSNHSEAGSYYVKMTSIFGCSRISDLVHIYENCNPSCSGLNETATTSFTQSCNDFSFTGTYTGSPVGVSWKQSRYLKRAAGHTDTQASFTTTKPGLHFVQYWVDYLINGNICRINIHKSFFKPYEAKFRYRMSCVSHNNTRDVTIIDHSLYADRTNVTYSFSRDGMPAEYSGRNSQYTFRNLAPGTYKFKIQLKNGSAYLCTEEKTVVVKGRPNAEFTVNYNPNCIENPILLAPVNYDPEYQYEWEFN